MTLVDVVDLSSDDELEELDAHAIKLEPNLVESMMQQNVNSKAQLAKHHISKTTSTRQGHEQNGSLRASSVGHSNSSVLDQGQSPVDETSLSSAPSLSPAPLCRQFWRAGNYDDAHGSKVQNQNGKNYLQVHPRFLHSNATSHKWAFGAIAELLDNAIDEIQNGATFVAIDRIANPRDGCSALLFQDDGGGMCPEAMRRCMSFGFTDKNGKSAIGRYGNGFKTSTMRLGGDVIVFSRHYDQRVLTQSIGLLSYTFLRNTGYDRIVVPMVHYQLNASTGKMNFLNGKEHYTSNLSKLLQWSPYSTEAELLKQFDDLGPRGTKVIIYNLWFGDDGVEEFDYVTDPRDIRITGDTRKVETIPAWKEVNEQHIGNTFRYSLRVYLSILYLKTSENFRIILRGEVVKPHNIADDLKYPEYILYKPQTGTGVEVDIVTTIGFLKEAPRVFIHGINVYHKCRLILPFWKVVNYTDSRGRGVVGILDLKENFIVPTHNKQDFEKTSLFQKLENRLKEMTWEYWDFHCGLLGYQAKKKPKVQMTPKVPLASDNIFTPVGFAKTSRRLDRHPPNLQSRDQQGFNLKRKEHGNGNLEVTEKAKRQAVGGTNANNSGQQMASEVASSTRNKVTDQETIILMQENEKLRAQCLEYEKEEKELGLKVTELNNEINEVENKYSQLLNELKAMETTKPEKNV